MANKKISQLSELGPVGVGTDMVFPIVSGTGPSTYTTCQVSAQKLKNFILDGWNTDSNAIGFTGSDDVYIDKSNWGNASNQSVASYPFLQIRESDGLLMTGSGVAFDSTTVPWDYDATENINMNGNDIILANRIRFQGTSYSLIQKNDTTDILLRAQEDLILSGRRHVEISGQVLRLTETPVSGDMTMKDGGITIPDGQGLTGDNIVINKTSRHLPHETDFTVNWSDSNIQYDTLTDTTSPAYTFSEALAGQTLTMYVKNTHSAPLIPTFTSGSTVLWGGTGGPPHLDNGRTNVYTFACYDGMLFASAITGYVNPSG
tara:strand:+ start:589 stop:1539 length:951 start_codon:yes stop_codon:yes gene_type:complete